jgi:hypothetical protein
MFMGLLKSPEQPGVPLRRFICSPGFSLNASHSLQAELFSQPSGCSSNFRSILSNKYFSLIKKLKFEINFDYEILSANLHSHDTLPLQSIQPSQKHLATRCRF